MSVPTHLHYSSEHEWVDGLSGVAKVGITDFAAEALGDIVFVQLPEEGTTLAAGDTCGEVESTKSVSELYAPAAGTVVAVNEAVVADPGLLNSDPFGAGWLYAVRIAQPPALMTAAAYEGYIGGAPVSEYAL
ncbi:glycine cleavage system protein GcvH [Hamadaea tsunoensis]|uniref:glycine cleavage system protein GcvH n=1 Tax=Hamadaea tsunoensis TaxID=53368 RepID=UPI0003F84F4C|nr:glycine cleavage system protein GcvH [Hamadaea tsunoensis]